MSSQALVARTEAIEREGRAALDAAGTLEELADAEREYLGKSSPLNEVREAIKTVDGTDRAAVGKAMSVARGARSRSCSRPGARSSPPLSAPSRSCATAST